MDDFLDKTDSLTPHARRIIEDAATEVAGSGLYCDAQHQGTYLCRRCGVALFRSDAKFIASCGWPSFDEEIKGAIKERMDPDGRRTEISCQQCGAHLGHVFLGEGMTEKNRRYCVNSASIDFVNSTRILNSEEGIFAGGCFWGIEHLFQQKQGVVFTEVGYVGGKTADPSYAEVCTSPTGHWEAVRIIFDADLLNYNQLCRYFFEIHDSSQANGQGPDIGHQYTSAIFYYNDYQYRQAHGLIEQLSSKGLCVATTLQKMKPFWRAEESHQQHNEKNGLVSACHIHKKIW